MTRTKIFFPLIPDEDGYPPVAEESVWAHDVDGGHFALDNIPFFATVATLGDVVAARMEGGVLIYQRTVRHCGNSLVRIAYRDTDPAEIRRRLEEMGCSSELDAHHKLIAVNIPKDVDLGFVQSFLQRGASDDKWGYEEPLLMQ